MQRNKLFEQNSYAMLQSILKLYIARKEVWKHVTKTEQLVHTIRRRRQAKRAHGDYVGTDQQIKKFTERKSLPKISIFSFATHVVKFSSELDGEVHSIMEQKQEKT